MDLVITDARGAAVAVLRDYALDMQWGDDDGGNDFELSRVPVRVEPGALVYVDGTEYGGVVDSDSPSHSVAGDSISYAGRTWHGVLAGKVLCPPEGSSHYTASGEANAAIAAMLAACPVGEPFAVSNADSGLTVPATRMPRYCTLYEALRRAMRAAGARLSIAATQAGVELAAVGVRDWGDAMEPGRASFSATRVHRPVNHLVVLGKGEMEARRVVHLYADVSGRVSRTQTLFGVDERAEVYELSSEEGAELESKAHEKLESLQRVDTAEADVFIGAGMAVGDRVSVIAPAYGIKMSAEVTGMVLKVEGGRASLSPVTGTPRTVEDRE